jgi:hypothetical protein
VWGETRLHIIDKSLEGEDSGSGATKHGKGFTMKRSDGQSLMLNVRVALSTLPDLLDSLDTWSPPYLHVVEYPKFDAEFQAWAKSSLLHRVYNYNLGKTHWRTMKDWAAIRIGYESNHNQVSILFNLILMGCTAACRC